MYPIEASERFEEKLLQYGYVPELIHEPLDRFIVDRIKAYEIKVAFPRIIPSRLQAPINPLNIRSTNEMQRIRSELYEDSERGIDGE